MSGKTSKIWHCVHLHYYQLHSSLQQCLLNANVKGILFWKTIVPTMQIVSTNNFEKY